MKNSFFIGSSFYEFLSYLKYIAKMPDAWQLGAIVSVVILLFIVVWYSSSSEKFTTDTIFLDQMAEKNSNPVYFKYSSWERDVDGMSPRDYYLENQTNYLNQVAPGYFIKDQLYVDHTGYLNMPPQYRPRGANQTNTMAPGSSTALHLSGKRGAFSGSMDKDVNMAYSWEKFK